jgi:hypothetical protein
LDSSTSGSAEEQLKVIVTLRGQTRTEKEKAAEAKVRGVRVVRGFIVLM